VTCSPTNSLPCPIRVNSLPCPCEAERQCLTSQQLWTMSLACLSGPVEPEIPGHVMTEVKWLRGVQPRDRPVFMEDGAEQICTYICRPGDSTGDK
jgi:hypothetical protein